jgi:uncharacterized damage-inducible protein DinB
MKRVEEIQQLYAYDRWANRLVLDAVENLTDEQFTRDLGNSFPSVRDTLLHILAAEWVWLSRWQGVSPRGLPDGWAEQGFARLRIRWREIEEAQAAFLADLDEARLDGIVEYSSTSGERYAAPLWQMLRHVANHSTYHRGQVTTMLRQMGAEPVATDLIHYLRSVGVESAEAAMPPGSQG